MRIHIKVFVSFCFSQKVETPYPLDSNLFDSLDLDTSLRINATLSMTEFIAIIQIVGDSPKNLSLKFLRIARIYDSQITQIVEIAKTAQITQFYADLE